MRCDITHIYLRLTINAFACACVRQNINIDLRMSGCTCISRCCATSDAWIQCRGATTQAPEGPETAAPGRALAAPMAVLLQDQYRQVK